MFNRSTDPQLTNRLQHLENHLKDENPLLRQVVRDFRELDRVAYRMGLFEPSESFAVRVPWWPIVSVLGVYSAGKSTFINDYLGQALQFTGNQAVDDKFTVITYSDDPEPRVLPGLALDADPRFPFYQISQDIDAVAQGEGRRIDAYLQLKTCPSDLLKGKILIDSPGFDADEQRTAVLRITNHIVDLSDLVLVFFDARKPEAGTMADTLNHLVADTIGRQDSNKFMYILNQLDTTAREDNAEDIIASWERALAQKGLTAGRFYRIYSREAAVPIENDAVRERYEAKRDTDMAEIDLRVQQVGVERSYRIVGALERSAKDFAETHVPTLQKMMAGWRARVMTLDVLMLIGIGAGLTLSGLLPTLGSVFSAPDSGNLALAGGALIAVVVLHVFIRKLAAGMVAMAYGRKHKDEAFTANYQRAFARNTRLPHSVFRKRPVGWGRGSRNLAAKVAAHAADHVQKLNSAFTNPSGKELSPKMEDATADAGNQHSKVTTTRESAH